jgi:hypothetical protein
MLLPSAPWHAAQTWVARSSPAFASAALLTPHGNEISNANIWLVIKDRLSIKSSNNFLNVHQLDWIFG